MRHKLLKTNILDSIRYVQSIGHDSIGVELLIKYVSCLNIQFSFVKISCMEHNVGNVKVPCTIYTILYLRKIGNISNYSGYISDTFRLRKRIVNSAETNVKASFALDVFLVIITN